MKGETPASGSAAAGRVRIVGTQGKVSLVRGPDGTPA